MSRTAPRVSRRGVVAQVRTALRPEARLATLIGFVLGGFVPAASYVLAHHEFSASARWTAVLVGLFIAGGLLYSALTVYDWARLAFSSPWKAVGFVLLLEGVMIFAATSWLALLSLCYLIGINGLATGCALSRKDGVT